MRRPFPSLCAATLALSLGATGCGSEGSSKKAKQSDEATPRFELTYDDVMEFERGVEGRYEIAGRFVDAGTSTITIDGLPDGARFENGVLTWLPPCSLKPEDGYFQHGYWLIRLRINLRNERADSLVQRPAVIIVHQRRQPPACTD